ncbi:uncharacterized protein SPSK_10184 [Sporothrix schenckii 1099-18]|uniref:Uncharacterized protein n=2 Tax=Sporothrix schenckii TaxID=29908 RepID=U7PXG2_SPOS1|nr:uncharacterized protein SPSK_10184 [Sporothrix schenckii 1099-18]ERT00349.1 hypothetical protein HMPREF1624_03720 [Sporothrix schenckii ATCC 58251]KJR85176.1 hypothetical protein SPSK_10184 [Sporothrix schenckii 1099-18]
MSAMIARTAVRAATRMAGQTSSFSTARVLRNTAEPPRRGGIAGIFPRRIGWGGALVLFSLGVADGTLSTTWYLSRAKQE